ncbi:hypothetical protein ACIHFD_04530 [Nonomuraea sp. NPDC051941]|uniref:hypothetical protein n=1 Tax=Nonomuraea sp. NPDC051941 TaxID=3364373 RepID=UPI0037CC2FAD
MTKVLRRSIGFALGTVVLLLLSAAGVLAASVFESILPSPGRMVDVCAPGRQVPVAFESYCLWAPARGSEAADRRVVDVRLSENAAGLLEVSVTAVVPKSDWLVEKVRSGTAIEDPAGFATNVLAYVGVSGSVLEWVAPVITSSAESESITISVTSVEDGKASRARDVETSLQAPGSIQMKTRSLIIAGVEVSDLSIVSQTGTSLHVKGADRGQLRMKLRSGRPSGTVAPDSESSSGLYDVLLVARLSLLAAIGWIAVFLAGRFGALGAIGFTAAWQRAEWAIGAVLLAHFVISAVSAGISLNTMMPHLPVNEFMREAELWWAQGSSRIPSVLVLLVALLLCGSLPWSSMRDSAVTSAPHRAIWRAMLVIAIFLGTAVGGFALLLTRTEAANTLSGDTTGWLPAAALFMVAALVAFAVLAFLGSWVHGGLRAALRPAPPGSDLIRWEQVLLGMLTLGVALIGGASSITWYGVVGGTRAPVELTGGWLLVMLLLTLPSWWGMIVTPIRELRRWPLSQWSPMAAIARLFGVAVLGAWCVQVVWTLVGDLGKAPLELPSQLRPFAVLMLSGCSLATAVRLSRRWRGRKYRIMQLTFSLTALIVLGVVATLDWRVEMAINWLLLASAGALMGVAVIRLVFSAITGRVFTSRALLLLAIPATLLAIPWTPPERQEPLFWNVYGYAVVVDRVLGLILVAVIVAVLQRLGTAHVSARDALREHRLLGLLMWFLALSDGYSLAGSPALLVLVAAAVGAWALLPARQVYRATHVLAQKRSEQNSAITWALHAGAARRTLPALGKSVRERTASEQSTFDEGQRAIEDLESRTVDSPARIQLSAERTVTVRTHQRAFGSLTSRRPWRRGLWGLATGTVVGSPWIALGLVGVDWGSYVSDGYPHLSALASLTPLLLGWPAYGLLFGYFFPLLRGDTGLTKSYWLFAAVILPGLVHAIPDSGSVDWRAQLLFAAQSFAFAMTLGILADRSVLTASGHRTARLVDIHNLWSLSAWASSITVAVATGVATILLAGLQPFVIGIINPAPAPTPPSAVGQP